MKTHESALLTDLYQLTMLQGFFQQGMHEVAVFEFFVRELPAERGFLLSAGLEQVVQFLENLHFSAVEMDHLSRCGHFRTDFLDWLCELRFTGAVDAMPEGTIFFPDEPILRVMAPIAQAQLVESRIINLLHYQTLIASKAVRCALAAPGSLLVDFGMRRAHGAEAALLAARASYLAGFTGTSTVLAECVFGVPAFGTMAHSFVQAHELESVAFEHFALAQPENVVLLIDTYDTEAAAHKVAALAPRLAARGITVRAVRLDSGDIIAHARRVRAILDAASLDDVKIFSSGNLDEYALQRCHRERAPIDGFGIGTRLDTSADAPYLDCAYKLQEYAGIPRRKRSEGKQTWPGRKQVYRQYDADGIMSGDHLCTVDEPARGEPLLVAVMQDGRLLGAPPTLVQNREHVRQQLARLPAPLRELGGRGYPVEVSEALRRLTREVDLQPH